jgi:hypothetical protein
MFYNVYDNKLLIPGKCGSRFVSSFNWQSEVKHNTPSLHDDTQYADHLKDIEWIVIREPHRLLNSAISTEVNSCLTNHTEWGYKKLNIGVINEIINNVLERILSNDGTSHYHLEFYKWIVEFVQSDMSNKNLKLIHLNDLSELINKLRVTGGCQYDKYNYDHSKSPYYISMDLIMEIVRNDFNHQWLKLYTKMQDQNEYWNWINLTSINRRYKKFL